MDRQTFSEHPFRQAIMDEAHARPVEIVPELPRTRRLVFILRAATGGVAAAMEGLTGFCPRQWLGPPG